VLLTCASSAWGEQPTARSQKKMRPERPPSPSMRVAPATSQRTPAHNALSPSALRSADGSAATPAAATQTSGLASRLYVHRLPTAAHRTLLESYKSCEEDLFLASGSESAEAFILPATRRTGARSWDDTSLIADACSSGFTHG
jgi:hypothetical protein